MEEMCEGLINFIKTLILLNEKGNEGDGNGNRSQVEQTRSS